MSVIAAKEAIRMALGYLQEVVPEFSMLEPQVEEIVRSSDSSVWTITFSALTGDNSKAKTLAELLRFRRVRKVVSVSTKDGALISVTNPLPESLAS
jgi:hypothetical protein